MHNGMVRMLKTLERSVKVGEDFDLFAGPAPGGVGTVPVSPKKASKKAKGKRRSKSQSGDEGEEEEIKVDVPKTVVFTDLDHAKLAGALETTRDSIAEKQDDEEGTTRLTNVRRSGRLQTRAAAGPSFARRFSGTRTRPRAAPRYVHAVYLPNERSESMRIGSPL
jgi:hypothetical protein